MNKCVFALADQPKQHGNRNSIICLFVKQEVNVSVCANGYRVGLFSDVVALPAWSQLISCFPEIDCYAGK